MPPLLEGAIIVGGASAQAMAAQERVAATMTQERAGKEIKECDYIKCRYHMTKCIVSNHAEDLSQIVVIQILYDPTTKFWGPGYATLEGRDPDDTIVQVQVPIVTRLASFGIYICNFRSYGPIWHYYASLVTKLNCHIRISAESEYHVNSSSE